MTLIITDTVLGLVKKVRAANPVETGAMTDTQVVERLIQPARQKRSRSPAFTVLRSKLLRRSFRRRRSARARRNSPLLPGKN